MRQAITKPDPFSTLQKVETGIPQEGFPSLEEKG
jgi:hypothetical protein